MHCNWLSKQVVVSLDGVASIMQTFSAAFELKGSFGLKIFLRSMEDVHIFSFHAMVMQLVGRCS